MDKSEVGVRVSISLAELFAAFGSVAPASVVTVAVFVSVPVEVLATVALTVKVAVPPGNRLTVVSMFSVPFGAVQLEPAEAVQVQVPMTRPLGMMSLTWAAVPALGPALVTTMVYVV